MGSKDEIISCRNRAFRPKGINIFCMRRFFPLEPHGWHPDITALLRATIEIITNLRFFDLAPVFFSPMTRKYLI